MPGTPELVSFRALLFAPRHAFADLFDDDRDISTVPMRVGIGFEWTFHSVERVFHIDYCNEVKPEWVLMAELMSEQHFSQEAQQNGISRALKENLVNRSLRRFADVCEDRFYEQSGKRRKCGMVARAASISRNKVAELLRFLTCRSGDEQINEECLDWMKEGQSDIYYVTGETTIAPMCPSDPLIAQPSMVALRKNGLVVTYTVDPLSGCAMQLLHEDPGTPSLLRDVPGTPSLLNEVPGTQSRLGQSRLGRMLGRVGHASQGADLERPQEAPRSQPWVRTLFNGRRIMFNADLQKWTRVKPKKNQTLAPNMMEKEMAEEEKEMAEEEKKFFEDLARRCQEEEKRMEKEMEEEKTKFQELAKKLEQEITEARASLYATGTGSSTTATGTTGQAAATKLHKA